MKQTIFKSVWWGLVLAASAWAQPVSVGEPSGTGAVVSQPRAAGKAGASTASLARAEGFWRAAFRWGYGPWPGLPVAFDGRSWAVEQLMQAARMAHQPVRIPVQWQGFEAPAPALFARFQAEREARRRGDDPAGLVFGRDLARHAALWRMAACSNPEVEHPVLARLTEFWFNHLNVSGVKGAVRPWAGHYVVHAIRPHVLGRYEDMLLASARHPAMLFYLDQAQSVAEGTPARTSGPGAAQGQARNRGLNENYARELMELHTLGVQGGYSQDDVRALAQMFSGWTVGAQSADGFRFVPRLHDNATKHWMGRTVAAAGEQEGVEAIRVLARHPATAQRIALRMAQWFVSDHPPAALVRRLAQRYTQTGGDLLALTRTLMESDEAWDPANRLFKTPMDYACSTLALVGGADERLQQQALSYLKTAGQPMLGWQTPDGYATSQDNWLSPEALTERADFAVAVGRAVAQPLAVLERLPPAIQDQVRGEPGHTQLGLALASPVLMFK